MIHRPHPPSLCEVCRHRRVIVSGRGSRFLLCEASLADSRLPKYPPQPTVRCTAYEPPAKDAELQPEA